MDPKEIGAPQEDHQVNLPGPLGLSETEAPTKEHTWAAPRPPCTYVEDVQFVHYAGLKHLERVWGAIPKVFPVCEMRCSSWAALSVLSEIGCA